MTSFIEKVNEIENDEINLEVDSSILEYINKMIDEEGIFKLLELSNKFDMFNTTNNKLQFISRLKIICSILLLELINSKNDSISLVHEIKKLNNEIDKLKNHIKTLL
jgi:hypothetical protein